MPLAWLLVLFVPVYKQLGLFMNSKRLFIKLPIINQRILNRLIIDISNNCPSPTVLFSIHSNSGACGKASLLMIRYRINWL